jgi:hypothetical protein
MTTTDNTTTDTTVTHEAADHPGRASRRGLLRLAGAAALGGAAAGLLSNGTASATTGAMQYGASNDSGTSTTVLTATATSTIIVNNTASGNGIIGQSTGSGIGVLGQVSQTLSSAYGVHGANTGTLGYGMVASGGQAQLRIAPAASMGPSNVSTGHLVGELAYDSTTNALWVCVNAGSPGAWRKVGGLGTAGAFHAISPSRVYDSRIAAGKLATGLNRTVSVANKIDNTGAVVTANIVPTGATAVTYNITVTSTVATGYLAVNEGNNTTVSASTINWFGAGQTLANAATVKLNDARAIAVICGGTGATTHFIVDVTGYYL